MDGANRLLEVDDDLRGEHQASRSDARRRQRRARVRGSLLTVLAFAGVFCLGGVSGALTQPLLEGGAAADADPQPESPAQPQPQGETQPGTPPEPEAPADPGPVAQWRQVYAEHGGADYFLSDVTAPCAPVAQVLRPAGVLLASGWTGPMDVELSLRFLDGQGGLLGTAGGTLEAVAPDQPHRVTFEETVSCSDDLAAVELDVLQVTPD